MKKLLLTALLLGGAFCVDIHARRGTPKPSAAPACIQQQIQDEEAKLTWSGFFFELMGLPGRDRLIAQKNICRLKQQKLGAQVQNIDTQNRVLEKWKNDTINAVYGLRYPALAAFIVASYYNSPAHDGTIPGQVYSGILGTAETTKIVATTTYDVGSYVGENIASGISTIANYAGSSVNDYLKHQYQEPTK